MSVELDMTTLSTLTGSFGGALSGWVFATVFKGMYEKKDQQHIASLEEHIKTIQQETASCHERYNILLNRVFQLEERTK